LKTRSPRIECWFCHTIVKYHVPDPPASPIMYGTGIPQEVGNGGQVRGDVETVGFPVQNVYKMTYGDENATFEPVNGYLIPCALNLWSSEAKASNRRVCVRLSNFLLEA